MRIAFVAPECDPIIKVGGLADVVGSLPRALQKRGHDVEIYIPRLGSIAEKFTKDAVREGIVAVRQFPLPDHATLDVVHSRGVTVHLVGCPELYEREPEPYGSYEDNPARFGFFALACLEAMAIEGRAPDAIHLHDWPTGLLPLYRSLRYKNTPLARAGILFTVHNLAHPGVFDKSWLRHLGLPDWLFNANQLEFYGLASMIKAGLLWSTMVGTVSPTYANEIQGPALGCRLDGVIRKRSQDLVGILNGIDTEIWDPARVEKTPDRSAWPVFDINDMSGKESHKSALRAQLKLNDADDAPIFGFVGRLDGQKGVQAMIDAMPQFLARGAQLAVLGDGADVYRNAFKDLARRFPGRVGGALEFNSLLAKRIYAGSDFFLMPSKFEPCGLAQMIACRYGTLPIVAWTGGLADTIRDADGYKDSGNGFTFPTPSTMSDDVWLAAASSMLTNAISRALAAYANKDRLLQLRHNAMSSDFSWDRSAELYERVFAEAARRERT
ncbi:MAG: glycogen synthase [Planctomycetes bacterium]|nr:glycogen synthase [Planctomycetota bacterium]